MIHRAYKDDHKKIVHGNSFRKQLAVAVGHSAVAEFKLLSRYCLVSMT